MLEVNETEFVGAVTSNEYDFNNINHNNATNEDTHHNEGLTFSEKMDIFCVAEVVAVVLFCFIVPICQAMFKMPSVCCQLLKTFYCHLFNIETKVIPTNIDIV